MSKETESVLHISEEEVTENLQEVLEKWPLYTKLTYQSEKIHDFYQNKFQSTAIGVVRISCGNEHVPDSSKKI